MLKKPFNEIYPIEKKNGTIGELMKKYALRYASESRLFTAFNKHILRELFYLQTYYLLHATWHRDITEPHHDSQLSRSPL